MGMSHHGHMSFSVSALPSGSQLPLYIISRQPAVVLCLLKAGSPGCLSFQDGIESLGYIVSNIILVSVQLGTEVMFFFGHVENRE